MSDQDKNPNDSLDENMSDSPEGASADDLGDRLERLGGEPAPAITPEEFERLQKAGQVHIDSRGARTNSGGAVVRKREFHCASAGLGTQ